MNVHQRTVSPEQAATPQAAGHGDIAHKQAVFRQGFCYGVVKLRIGAALLAQPLLSLPDRLLHLHIPLGTAPLAALYFFSQRAKHR